MPSSLGNAAKLSPDRVIGGAESISRIQRETPVLVVLAAGKGTRFGTQPKCIQTVSGKPLARHSIDAFQSISPSPSICLIGYQADRVKDALSASTTHCEPAARDFSGCGDPIVFVRSTHFTGGTAWAAMEAFTVDRLSQVDPIVVISMGDRIVPEQTFRQLIAKHTDGGEADLTLLTAMYERPSNRGKGRIVRDADGAIERIVEQRDIDTMSDRQQRARYDALVEGNCPLYAIRAATLHRYLSKVTPDNAQQQYYFTDIVEAIGRSGGTIRSITADVTLPEHALLCADVTSQKDLPTLQRILSDYQSHSEGDRQLRPADQLAGAIASGRARHQTLSIANQCEQLNQLSQRDPIRFDPSAPVGVGVSGGRLRIAFMHPDMGRFFGPAWQMPIGAGSSRGREQIVVMIQEAGDNQIHLYPAQPQFRESIDAVPADLPWLDPPEQVVDAYSYECFGTTMTQQLLSALGYVSDTELTELAKRGQALPEPATWVSNAMRRPFALLANVIAAFRTIRSGTLGRKVHEKLGDGRLRGLRVVSTGEIPRGGFSSSSAFTVAIINALDALFEFQLTSEQKIRLACRAEFGTGVRAGALDQATEQSGRFGRGTLISSNPKEDFRILGTYDVPADRFRVLFPYTLDRDSQAWKWSAGVYASQAGQQGLTSEAMRKMSGKASELAAILSRLPLDVDYFQEIEPDLVEQGQLTHSSRLHVRDRLRQIPLRITQDALRDRMRDQVDWYVDSRRQTDPSFTHDQAHRTFDALLAGWCDPRLRRTASSGEIREEVGAPLRAMVAYLYAEVSINCYLIHHPDQWIDCVTRSQRGDRCFDISTEMLPSKQQMLRDLGFERSVGGTQRLERWLQRFDASPFDFNRGIENHDLRRDDWCLRRVEGTNFFRGLALIDLAEAMLKRAFGQSAIAVRVNGAGQGDYFQVHIDTEKASVQEVKDFIRRAIYRRFDLKPSSDFVEPHSGGGAVGIQLTQHADLPQLIQLLRGEREQGDRLHTAAQLKVHS